MPTVRKGALPRASQSALRELLERLGEAQTSELLHVSRATCLRGALGLPQSRAIRTAIAIGLEKVQERGPQ